MTVSVPSYIFRGTYLENVRLAASLAGVQGVELLFFLYDGDSRGLLLQERSRIAAFSGELLFSVHLPDPLLPAHEELVELTADLAERYVLHPPQGDEEATAAMLEGWRRRYGDRFLLENLIDRGVEEMLARLPDLPLCCDTGHLLLGGGGVGEFLERYGRRVREVHLHGQRDGWDHRPVAAEDPWFRAIVPWLRRFSGAVNLEVFHLEEVQTMLALLREQGLAR